MFPYGYEEIDEYYIALTKIFKNFNDNDFSLSSLYPFSSHSYLFSPEPGKTTR